ncbi:MAG: succinate dehydrogenase, hydrophobic membrane anchor protein [Gammaproteobacteria bacterium RIFCSPHIGHO2_12_FULL_38_11]|nr:MAG: succinate dehydrogenase, hydrophobic membrane anchor protein [Gammaproteobacteria bacterium RIFCSPHIGHO2_12_FULL_38_11]
MVAKNNRGFHEWIVQRVSAVIIGIYAAFLLVYLLCHQPLHYTVWSALFSHIAMKAATFVVLIAILWHAWIGLWTVFTDYVKNTAVRLVLEIVVILLLLSYLVWCVVAL